MKKTTPNQIDKRKRFLGSSIKKVTDITIIKKHMLSLDNESIKRALVANGMYDNNMKLTASFR